MYVVFIHGPAAAGKYTVGRRLSELTDLPLFHNHLAVDAAATLFDFGTEPFKALRADIWRSAFRAAAQADRSFIFTFHPEATVAPELIDELCDIVERKGGKVYFVELLCSTQDILERIGNFDRARFGKLTDANFYVELERRGMFNFPPLPNPLLKIDTTLLSPEEAAEDIAAALPRSEDS